MMESANIRTAGTRIFEGSGTSWESVPLHSFHSDPGREQTFSGTLEIPEHVPPIRKAHVRRSRDSTFSSPTRKQWVGLVKVTEHQLRVFLILNHIRTVRYYSIIWPKYQHVATSRNRTPFSFLYDLSASSQSHFTYWLILMTSSS